MDSTVCTPLWNCHTLQRLTSERLDQTCSIESWCGRMRDSKKYTGMRGQVVVQKAIHEAKCLLGVSALHYSTGIMEGFSRFRALASARVLHLTTYYHVPEYFG